MPIDDSIVRPALLADARGIAEISVNSWRTAYAGIVPAEHLESLSLSAREAGYTRLLGKGTAELLVAERCGELAGFVSFGKCREENVAAQCGEVEAIYVRPEIWSHGVGRDLWSGASQRLRELGFTSVMLWVLAANERAQRFYGAAGFVENRAAARTITIGGKALSELWYERSLT